MKERNNIVMVITMNPFIYSNDNKRYHTFNYYLRNKYQSKVAKVSLNAGFTCPNRDGSKSKGGCIFCSDSGSGDFAGNVTDNLLIQFDTVKKLMYAKWPNCKLIAYFQANSNTYGTIEKLKECFEPFINKNDVVGIDIATRPDCLNQEIVDYLADVNQRTNVTVELGLQTIHERTAKLINRAYDFECFKTALNYLRSRNIDVCVHVINGLPYESKEEMLETIQVIAQLDIQFIKIHMLYILKDTTLHKLYKQKPFAILSRDEYIQLVVDQIEYIPQQVVIQRLTGDAKIDDLIEPSWSIKKVTLLNDIDKELERRDSMQGVKINNVLG